MLRRRSGKAAERGRAVMQRLSAWIHGAGMRCVLILLAGGLAMFMLYSVVCMSGRYDLKVGDIAPQDIAANREVVDALTTEQNRRAAAQAVEASYHRREETDGEVMASLNDVLAELSLVQQFGQELRLQNGMTTTLISFSADEMKHAKSLITKINLSDYQVRVLLQTDTDSFNTMVIEVRDAVESALQTTIREGQVSKSISNILTLCQYSIETKLVNTIVPSVLTTCVKANMVVDEEATERARQEARDAVSPVVYKQSQIIVRKGAVIGANQLAMLQALGLLDTTSYDFSIFGGALLLTACALTVLALLLRLLTPKTFKDMRSMLVIMLVMVVNEALAVICVKLINVYLAPVALCSILLTGLLGARVGVSGGLTMTIIIAGLAAASGSDYSVEMVYLLLTGCVSSVVSVHFLSGKPQRVRAVVCGAIAALTNLLLMLAVGLMTATDLHNTLGNAIWSMAGALLSGLIAVGFQPVFEATFNLATPSKLLELANPNQPILRRLQMEAPGTYHHSIVVANLAEAAAEKIGANPLLARTGAYFHDVGKLKRPMYFKENQRGENPHDHTDAYVSAAIVTSHTRDGLVLAQRHHLPPEIQRIIIEHHGDTPVMYFYHKALQQAGGKPVDVKDFRYEGSRPSTKESAIVMLADTIEAAVRSMADPTPQAIERFIERLVRGKIEDGQLSKSPLSLHDIDGICEAFSNVLSGVFHERIEYPTVQLNAGEAAAVQEAQPAAQAAAAKPSAPVESDTDTMPAPYNAPMPDGLVPPAAKPEEGGADK